MKLKKQIIEEIKNKLTNIKTKVTMESKNKVPKKYYALLILMIMLGTITLFNNIKRYNKSIEQDFKKYVLDEQVSSNVVEVKSYEKVQSSISTNVANIMENNLLNVQQSIPTISSNNKSEYIMPVSGEIIKEFAMEKLVYSETLGMWKTHPGIDIKCELNTNVKSASSGIVEEIKDDSFYGNTIKIVDNEGYTFVYSNMDNDILVNKGEAVQKGEIIGKVGVSAKGELQDQTHLHFEILKEEKQVNPQDLIN